MPTNELVLKREQAHFDDAWLAREATRATLSDAGSASGGPRKVAAAVKNAADERLQRLGGSDDAVAFGRVDVGDDVLYIGNHAITNDDFDLLVVNWQAPAARPYFEATFANPLGATLRRTFQCERNTIQGFDDVVFEDLARRVAQLDASAEEVWGINDALLSDLEAGRSGEMREIVQTIHHAQYALIRSEMDQLLVIQGGPGTGKTAVALHRVSWLLYNHAPDLLPQDVMVVGPSDTFTRYIRSVLPGLGDDNVVYRDLRSLGPQKSTGRNEGTSIRRLKGELRMASLLHTALWQRVRVPDRMKTLQVGSGFSAVSFSREEIEAELPNHVGKGSYTVGRASFRNFLQREVEARNPRGPGATAPVLDAAVERVWPSLSAVAFLRDLFGSRDRLLAAAGDRFTGTEIGRLFRQASDKVADEQWSDVDVALLDEAEELLNGRPSARYRHIVVDEAQDLSPMQLRSIRRRSESGSMTVVGDLAQSTGPWARESWDDITTILASDLPAQLEQLELGYRVPRQVYEFAAQLLPYIAPGLKPPTVVRDGPADPELVEVDEFDVAGPALAAARSHAGSGRFVGLICPDRHRRRLEEELVAHDVKWANVGSGNLDSSINVARPSESKGLEFDAVVVVDPEAIVGESDWGLRHLYVALTRTTKYLTVLHTGVALPLPTEQASDALIELAEVRGLEQAALFDAPPPARVTERTPRDPSAESSRPNARAASRTGSTSTSSLNVVIAKRAAEALAADLREAVAPHLWEAVISELREELGLGDS
ncbi:hypothetical protein N802_13625 [Knoellia sinensis KCTC 19936]|uniref:UvrD-like helicase ATP-binding domain-containing protein n=1 Tax=Knoellia sinensis KCTC 19936 TaxID=1385520 RepID=A0A0A0J1F9_9MICO|nr:UvrD-helicase domain-containing protein [Knoellia sinensis]KGN29461.1 hypothetical protein N802_13625 [Knoellia sinensis KCTC 19936]